MQELELKSSNLDYRTKEAFKTLRTNIEFSGENVKVICLTSATPNEGKSSVSFELAVSFAQNGKKTLLIDADLRKSVMKSKYKKGIVRNGVTNVLAGRAEPEEALCHTDITGLYMMFAGPVPPNPSELLGNAIFRKLVEDARKNYDVVIIDTPPIGSVIDAAVVARNCDGIIIVMECGAISCHFAGKIKEQLEAAGVRILGCVLNKVNLSGKGYYGKYYGRYYGKYYGKYYGNYGNEE